MGWYIVSWSQNMAGWPRTDKTFLYHHIVYWCELWSISISLKYNCRFGGTMYFYYYDRRQLGISSNTVVLDTNIYRQEMTQLMDQSYGNWVIKDIALNTTYSISHKKSSTCHIWYWKWIKSKPTCQQKVNRYRYGCIGILKPWVSYSPN